MGDGQIDKRWLNKENAALFNPDNPLGSKSRLMDYLGSRLTVI